MMRIYAELQLSEGVQSNITLKRTEAVSKFSTAAINFQSYLEKYDHMCRVVRLFKFAKMEKERLAIVEEIDDVCRMLNLAAAVTVMDGAAAAATNTAQIFAKLATMHGDITFTHDQIHAALLADKQAIASRNKQFAAEKSALEMRDTNQMGGERVLHRHTLGDALKNDIREQEITVVPTLSSDVEPKQGGFTTSEVEMKSESEPVTAGAVLEANTVVIDAVKLGQTAHSGDSDNEEREQNHQRLTLFQNNPNDQRPAVAVATVDKLVQEKEEKQSNHQQSSPLQESADELDEAIEEDHPSQSNYGQMAEVVESKEGENEMSSEQPPEADNTVVVFAEKEEQDEHPIDELLDEVDDNENDEGATKTKQPSPDTVDGVDVQQPVSAQDCIDEVVVERLCAQPTEEVELGEDQESRSQYSVSLSDTTDEPDEEEDAPLHHSGSFLLDKASVPLLIRLLGSDDATVQQKEEALLDLLGKCVTNSNRVQVYKTKGIPVLAKLVREGETFFTQLYALHCLNWFTFSYSKMRESEFEMLYNCVREPAHTEMLSLLHDLQSGDEEVQERAALQCSCMATRGAGDALRQVGVLPLLIGLVKDGTANQKLWATEALLTLASDNDDNCVAITRGGAIPPLVSLLRSGTDMHKQEAAYALGNLAANNEVNRAKIAREGAIPPMC
ncbi:unnamed protein product [Phytophthora fragariaefolia]|uniref:Unnamed protein product n=1 Tax=Phytophthora fragariaefolia TaxID=1490495 RepID=A0A9W6XQC0_9STRA|nr:unnamed protein product [Phytophthora fragariaefolia]